MYSRAIQVSDVEAKVGKKKTVSLLSRMGAPINTNFENERGIAGYDPEFPIKEVVKDAPRLMRDQAKVRIFHYFYLHFFGQFLFCCCH